MFERCGDVYPRLPRDLVCVCVRGHTGPHNDGESLWEGDVSAVRRREVEIAQREAADRAERHARIEALGGRAPRGGLVGNRAQRRAGLRRGR